MMVIQETVHDLVVLDVVDVVVIKVQNLGIVLVDHRRQLDTAIVIECDQPAVEEPVIRRT